MGNLGSRDKINDLPNGLRNYVPEFERMDLITYNKLQIGHDRMSPLQQT